MHQVASAFVGGQVIVEAAIWRLADTRLLGAAPPVPHVVTRTQALEPAQMVAVHFAGVARHGLSHAENLRPPRAQKTVPEPHVGPKLGVIPSEAADVVAPHMSRPIMLVHHIAVVPEAVP